MNAKEYLSEYRKLNIKIELLNRDIEKLLSEIGGGSISLGIEKVQTSVKGDQVERLAIQLAELKTEREAILALCIRKLDEIERTIFRVEDPVYQKLLHDKYISLMNWSEIAEDLGYNSEEYVRGRLHSKALQAVEFIIRN